MPYRELTIENSQQKKVFILKIDESNEAGRLLLASELFASFDHTTSEKQSGLHWTISSAKNGEINWKITGKDNDVIDFALFSDQTGKNIFTEGKKDREFLQLKLARLGLREISIKNIKKTHS